MAFKRKKSTRRLKGTSERPRLTVFRSNTNIFAQIVDDIKGVTLVSASSLKIEGVSKVDAAKEVGKQIASKAVSSNVKKVFFDRGSFTYKGRVKALAEAAREQGLEF
jgi:large subunit ribosomal protein L18